MVVIYTLLLKNNEGTKGITSEYQTKDGTKRTHAEWAETNNFTWYSEETLPEEWK